MHVYFHAINSKKLSSSWIFLFERNSNVLILLFNGRMNELISFSIDIFEYFFQIDLSKFRPYKLNHLSSKHFGSRHFNPRIFSYGIYLLSSRSYFMFSGCLSVHTITLEGLHRSSPNLKHKF